QQECREANTTRKRRQRSTETSQQHVHRQLQDFSTKRQRHFIETKEQRSHRNQSDATFYHQHHSNKPQLKNFARNFAEISPGMCCSNGKIQLYNSAFTFASISITIDPKLANARNSVYMFRTQGSFYYRIGLLLPNLDCDINSEPSDDDYEDNEAQQTTNTRTK
ncbi:19017_t:CDS:2, partial [Dentiscutata erythropus]